jgi:hypothetical protein
MRRRTVLLREDLFDPGYRLVDRLLGADALGHDVVDRLRPDPLVKPSIISVLIPINHDTTPTLELDWAEQCAVATSLDARPGFVA